MQRAAESYSVAEGKGPLNDLDLSAAAEALLALFETALQTSSPRLIRGVRVLIDAPHVFFFREDRLNRYVGGYARLGGSGGKKVATERAPEPLEASPSRRDEVLSALSSGKALRSSSWEQSVPTGPGYYAILVDNADSMPALYRDRLNERRSRILYVGIATKSLANRLLKQDLRHRAPSSFFRSLGAALGYRPPAGSLAGAVNKRNYMFSPQDTAEIVQWIDAHVSVRVVVDPAPSTATERDAIQRIHPLLNIDENPSTLLELIAAREECRAIARSDA